MRTIERKALKVGDTVDIRGNKAVGEITKVLLMPGTGIYYEVKIAGHRTFEYFKPRELSRQAN